MRIRILGRYWRFTFGRLRRLRVDGHYIDGITDASNRTIQIDNRIRGQKELETIIHEYLHACDQCADLRVAFIHSEDFVTAQARDLSRLLWKLGYKRNADTANGG